MRIFYVSKRPVFIKRSNILKNIQDFPHVIKKKPNSDWLDSTTQSRLLTTLRQRAFENIVGKGAGNQHFLLFPHCFLL